MEWLLMASGALLFIASTISLFQAATRGHR